MASIEPKQSTKPGKRPTRKSTRVDMTAMVDVAFLLLTFFILSTQLPSTVGIMETAKPDESEPKEIACEKNLTLFLGENDQIFWYAGCDPEQLQTAGYGPAGIRKVLMQENAQRRDLIISVKPGELSNFENLVSIIDEITIAGAKKYALATLSPAEKDWLVAKGKK